MMWAGMTHFYSRQFDAAIECYQEVIRLRPGYSQTHVLIAASLAHLGRLDEARVLFKRAQVQAQDMRFQSSPWTRPEDQALRDEGIRLAAGEMR
jgi:adenylate cyclase